MCLQLTIFFDAQRIPLYIILWSLSNMKFELCWFSYTYTWLLVTILLHYYILSVDWCGQWESWSLIPLIVFILHCVLTTKYSVTPRSYPSLLSLCSIVDRRGHARWKDLVELIDTFRGCSIEVGCNYLFFWFFVHYQICGCILVMGEMSFVRDVIVEKYFSRYYHQSPGAFQKHLWALKSNST